MEPIYLIIFTTAMKHPTQSAMYAASVSLFMTQPLMVHLIPVLFLAYFISIVINI